MKKKILKLCAAVLAAIAMFGCAEITEGGGNITSFDCPAVLTIAGVCGVRIAWIELMFPKYLTFRSIMTAYPISLSATALMILTALLICHPAARGSKANKEQ